MCTGERLECERNDNCDVIGASRPSLANGTASSSHKEKTKSRVVLALPLSMLRKLNKRRKKYGRLRKKKLEKMERIDESDEPACDIPAKNTNQDAQNFENDDSIDTPTKTSLGLSRLESNNECASSEDNLVRDVHDNRENVPSDGRELERTEETDHTGSIVDEVITPTDHVKLIEGQHGETECFVSKKGSLVEESVHGIPQAATIEESDDARAKASGNGESTLCSGPNDTTNYDEVDTESIKLNEEINAMKPRHESDVGDSREVPETEKGETPSANVNIFITSQLKQMHFLCFW